MRVFKKLYRLQAANSKPVAMLYSCSSLTEMVEGSERRRLE